MPDVVPLLIQCLHPLATLPARASAGAAGLDLSACLPDGPVTVDPMAIVLVPTGLALAIEAGHEGQVRPRSGLAVKHGITIVNAPGTIDSDYRGELKVGLINLSRKAFVIEHGMRVAQLVIAPVTRVEVRVVESLSETERGSGGFGSTGYSGEVQVKILGERERAGPA